MQYREDLGYKYPERSDHHMIDVKHLRDTNFDENYLYYDKRPWTKFKRGVLWVLLNTVVFLIVTIRHGLRIHGKEILKRINIIIKMVRLLYVIMYLCGTIYVC